ncbi:helix-turn-helix domain-containing protein [Halomarina litorea]|uniref:helix-turn-helix domain-containing protein n=1 Tax=Halomarina litorea TaxID=2961595 RepID=UPI0020C528D6|nr:helix-turn-helix domain-containing protein [Halomarina sp. BCD28]
MRTQSGEGSDESLTDEESAAIHAALDTGYFDGPRGTSLGGVADRLDVTDREASRRLRRGMSKVVRRNRERFECHPDSDERFPPHR